MSASINALMEFGKTYGWAVSDYEDRRSDETLDAMEIAEQEFRSALAAALNQVPSGEAWPSPVAPLQVSTTTVLIGQIKVMAELLQASVGVLRTVDPESTEERELLQTLIDQSEAAIATVLTEHAMGGKAHG